MVIFITENEQIKVIPQKERRIIEKIFAPNIDKEFESRVFTIKNINGKTFGTYNYEGGFVIRKNNDIPENLETITIIRTSIKKDGDNDRKVNVKKTTIINNPLTNEKTLNMITQLEEIGFGSQEESKKIIEELKTTQHNLALPDVETIMEEFLKEQFPSRKLQLYRD